MRRSAPLPCPRTCWLALVLFVLSLSCRKASDDDNRIPGIDGTYKGGTLNWNNANGASGSDPNFTFTVTSPDASSIQLDIQTTAPIVSRRFTLPLTEKTESNGSGQYTFSNSEQTSTYSKNLVLIITRYPAANNYALLDYTHTTTSAQDENFDGDGFRQ